jgi:hypothetical protein
MKKLIHIDHPETKEIYLTLSVERLGDRHDVLRSAMNRPGSMNRQVGAFSDQQLSAWGFNPLEVRLSIEEALEGGED